jgi:hypothetical protein
MDYSVDAIRKCERELFPEFRDDRVIWEGTYAYFAPSYHVEAGLITEEVFEGLQDGARLLSVGCGKLHLEQLLALVTDARPEQITVADAIPPPASSFPSLQFDMFEKWPATRQFDYILFPRSVFLGRSEKFYDEQTAQKRLTHLIDTSRARLTERGEMRMSGFLPDAHITDAVRAAQNARGEGIVGWYHTERGDFLKFTR